ncbi:hypothetical protein Tco_0418196 [Tanacetum coccineum]
MWMVRPELRLLESPINFVKFSKVFRICLENYLSYDLMAHMEILFCKQAFEDLMQAIKSVKTGSISVVNASSDCKRGKRPKMEDKVPGGSSKCIHCGNIWFKAVTSLSKFVLSESNGGKSSNADNFMLVCVAGLMCTSQEGRDCSGVDVYTTLPAEVGALCDLLHGEANEAKLLRFSSRCYDPAILLMCESLTRCPITSGRRMWQLAPCAQWFFPWPFVVVGKLIPVAERPFSEYFTDLFALFLSRCYDPAILLMCESLTRWRMWQLAPSCAQWCGLCTEMLELFNEEEHILGMKIVGGDYRLHEESILIALTYSDILARAKNGIGKTITFCIPAIDYQCPLFYVFGYVVELISGSQRDENYEMIKERHYADNIDLKVSVVI